MRVILFFAIIALLWWGHSESTEKAHERGYEAGLHDGWVQTCNDIARFSSRIEDVLERERIC